MFPALETRHENFGATQFIPPDARRLLPHVNVWKNPKNKFDVFWLFFKADPEKRDPRWEEFVKSTMDSDAEFNLNYNIDFYAMSGKKVLPGLPVIWPEIEYEPKVENGKVVGLPKHWRRYIGMDRGTTPKHNSSLLLIAIDEKGEPWFDWAFKGHRATIYDLVDMVVDHPEFQLIESIFCDPSLFNKNQSAKEENISLIHIAQERFMERLGKPFSILPGNKTDGSFIEYWFKMAEGCGKDDPPETRHRPRIHVSSKHPEIKDEMFRLTYVRTSDTVLRENMPKSKLVDKNNDLWDAAKYVLLSGVGSATALDEKEERIQKISDPFYRNLWAKRRQLEKRALGGGVLIRTGRS